MNTTVDTAPAVKLARLERLRSLQVATETGRPVWVPLQHQVPPPTGFFLWLCLAGRGAGKTDACANYFDRYMRHHPGHRGSIVAPTMGDAVEACVKGPSGLMAHNPRVKLTGGAGGYHVVWPNGSEAKLFGTYTKEDIERLRAGGNRHLVWAEELAAWRYLSEAWEQIELGGARLGTNPHVIGSTTPKPRPKLRELIAKPSTVVTRATTNSNPHLAANVRAALYETYGGTRLGRQELEGELIDDVEGALWSYRLLEKARVEKHPDLQRVLVAVDPSGGDEAGNDEQGIVVAGLGVDGHGYVLADRSCKLTPGGWGKRVVRAWQEFDADLVVAETNYGGAMVKSTVEQAAVAMGVAGLKVDLISASRGKVARAEPVAALYEQGRVHHVDVFGELEYQMTQWTAESGWSPDRLDSLVWALSKLMLGPQRRRWGPA